MCKRQHLYMNREKQNPDDSTVSGNTTTTNNDINIIIENLSLIEPGMDQDCSFSCV